MQSLRRGRMIAGKVSDREEKLHRTGNSEICNKLRQKIKINNRKR
jgi:hypothetical protein